jgi:hypothetical protein
MSDNLPRKRRRGCTISALYLLSPNRQNAQARHGATTPEGKQRSSLNATKHGLTGETLVLSAEEQAPYAQFVKEYFEEWQPFDVTTRQLTQQLADDIGPSIKSSYSNRTSWP